MALLKSKKQLQRPQREYEDLEMFDQQINKSDLCGAMRRFEPSSN